MKFWTEEETKYLIENYKIMSYLDISKVIGRSVDNILHKASRLKLYKYTIAHDDFCNYIEENSNIKILSKYISMNDNITAICLKHNYEWISKARSIYRTLRCPRCHINKKRNHDDFVIEINNISPEIEIVSKFVSTSDYVDCICLKNSHKFRKKAIKLLSGQACPICRLSKGEKRVHKYLLDNNFNFTTQKTFDTCIGVDGWKLKFDFCIYDNNNDVYLLVEYQGDIHFRVVDHMGGEDGYYKRIMYDCYKTWYADKKEIPLLHIKYTDFKNIEKILEWELYPLRKEE